jgi:LuxR family maltose regulon positive regulatory protein
MEGKRHDVPTSGVGELVGALAPTTWFGVPAVPADYVRRPRLFQLLDHGATSPLILVSGPAGSGKTSLVADWLGLRASAEHTEWVTFEREDEAFWPGVLTALTRLGVAVPSRSFPAGTAAVDRQLLTALAMEIARAATPYTLVLDGYEMASKDVANDLDYLLRHTGGRLHLVLVTRVDPILPLYRYRLEDRLTEIRMVDLAFTDAEAEELMRSADLTLRTASVHALNERTHGWVAGLRFASRFLGKSEDPDAAVTQVSGDSGDIGEYLMGEVLAAQTPENRRLLLSTSIPAVIRPGLAEALGGRTATRMLSVLARVNAFVEPVPEHPGFYRYHPFFRDLLRAELAYEAPEEMERLQRAAAEWFAQEGFVAASVGHYAEIGAWADAAGTVVDELAFAQLLTGGADDSLARVLMPIPDELRDPAASVVRAALALGQGDSERVTTELAQVSTTASSAGDGHGGALSLAVAVLQSIRARGSDDAHKAFELAEEAEEALTDRRRRTRAEAQHELSALVFASKGIAALRRGRLSDAHELFTDGSESALSLGSEPLLVECQGYLALIACLRDQLSEAVSFADRAVATADGVGIRLRDRSAAPQVALAWVDMERYDLIGAAKHVKLATVSDAFLGDRVPGAMLALTRSRIQAARGDVDGAISIVEKTTEGIADGNEWLAAQLRLEALRLQVAKEDVAGVVSATHELEEGFPAEVALIAADVGLVEGDDEAVTEALSHVFSQGSRPGMQVAAWLVEATRQFRNGSPGKARAAVERSLRLAAPEGFRRQLHEAPLEVAGLLPDATSFDPAVASVRRPGHTAKSRVDPSTGVHAASDSPATLVVERLTEKELEVLGHLAELLTTEEIAETMFVSVNTVRTHVRNILRKLGVPRRNAAVRRARELNLLPA